MKYPTSKWRIIFASLAFFAMGLSLLAQTAPLWAKKIDGKYIEICSALGVRTIMVDNNLNQIPETPQPVRQKQNTCDICFISAAHITPPLALSVKHHQNTFHKITYPHFNISEINKTEYTPRNSRAPPHQS